jgi:hypothetical protein
MVFEVMRTSSYRFFTRSDNPPCEGAFPSTAPKWHTIPCSEEEYNKRYSKGAGGLWREKGTNHSVTLEGHIRRQEGVREIWAIEISSLEQLVSFISKYGEIVMDDGCIEIYDSYRE